MFYVSRLFVNSKKYISFNINSILKKKLEKTVESEFEIGNRHKRSSHEKVAMSKIPKFSKIFLEPEATLTKYEFLTKISRLPSQ